MIRSIRRNAREVVLGGLLTGRKRQAQRPPPDFVIAGAQRCGTTSLFRALGKHPAIMPNVINAKGVHYFDTNYHQDEAWYFAHFASQSERNKHSNQIGHRAIVGEASPYYLYHPAGAERMAQTIPEAKIIILLRDPIKRAVSHHLHMVWEGHESVEDINTALDLESSRLDGIEQRLIAERSFVSRPHQHYSYLARGHYAAQLERLLSYYDRNNVLVMATETLISDSKNSLSTIQSFIGLEPDPAIDLEKRNASPKFKPEQKTLERLTEEFSESNKRLGEIVDIEIPWL